MIVIPSGNAFPNNPRIGWDNIVEDVTASASSSATGFPVTNLQNDLTFLYWRAASSAAQTITFTPAASETLDYLGIARHNLGTIGATYKLEGSNNGVDWVEIIPDTLPTDDGIILHEFVSIAYPFWRLSVGAGSAAAQIAVVYLGELLTIERRIYVGHVPLPFGLKSHVSTNRSESGQYLGRVLRRKYYETNINLQNIDPTWCRANVEPMIERVNDRAFFWAWRPTSYPSEVGYVWTKDDINPANQRPNGMMEWSAAVQGIIE